MQVPTPSLKDIYRIEPIANSIAEEMVVKNHYLHRKAPCSFAFGMIDNGTDEIVGVIMYGTPFSSTLRAGVCGPDEANNVIELTRLWIKDGTPKNSESFLIGNTMRKVDKEILVSYAEIQAGHRGVVYQATNWIYTGLSAKRTDWKVRGVETHSQTLSDKYKTADKLREVFGERFYYQERPRKHRYVFFNCNRRRRKVLLSKLRYPILGYPKC